MPENYKRIYNNQWRRLGVAIMKVVPFARTYDEDTKSAHFDVGIVMDSIMQSDWLQEERRIAYLAGMKDAITITDDFEESLDEAVDESPDPEFDKMIDQLEDDLGKDNED